MTFLGITFVLVGVLAAVATGCIFVLEHIRYQSRPDFGLIALPGVISVLALLAGIALLAA